MSPFRAPADAWSRRDFMVNGFSSLALLCTIAPQSSLKGAEITKSTAPTSAPSTW